MRVVAGELRGRRLHVPRGSAVRPTADRVREAIFSILGDIGGTRALDLFCGTGALGIEAVSRGAASAVLVDSRTAAAHRNVAALGLEERIDVVRADVVRHLKRERSRFDLVFCDPPYDLAERLQADLGSLVAPRLAEGGRLITESAARRPLELDLPLQTERRYGDTVIRVHTGARR